MQRGLGPPTNIPLIQRKTTFFPPLLLLWQNSAAQGLKFRVGTFFVTKSRVNVCAGKCQKLRYVPVSISAAALFKICCAMT